MQKHAYESTGEDVAFKFLRFSCSETRVVDRLTCTRAERSSAVGIMLRPSKTHLGEPSGHPFPDVTKGR